MAKALIITEKPSVARDIVAALGGFTARASQSYWESDAYLCTYAVGHILQLLEPEDIDPAYRSWRLATLPIIPRDFRLKPVEGQEERLALIRRLVERDDVRVVINACDAAREGELIFREILTFLGCRKWVRRLWLQSMTPEAIRRGFAELRDGTDFEGLGAAAECRARADWLIGMNATRAFSERLRARQQRTPWSVGRVQTPTLALLVDRELKILGHRSRPFWRLEATFAAADHTYKGVWYDPAFKANERQPELKDDRLFERTKAEGLVRLVAGQPALASERREESPRHAPYLFSLTGLQKYMSTRYKWTAKRTLEAAQRCYEQHKVLTYPRTNSSCLPSDYRGEVQRLLGHFAGEGAYADHARYLQKHGLCNEARTFNDQGVDDHFAIIPTGRSRSLSGDDGRLYDAVVRRFLATFFPPALYDKVRRTTEVAGQLFRTGPVETLIVPGWLAVYDKEAPEQPTQRLPPLVPGQKRAEGVGVRLVDTQLAEEVTKPPLRITEAGLLGLMEHAGRQVEDEQLASALMSAEGLGTAATRADIIQNLKAKNYVDENLRPTFKGIHLILTLQRVKAERLTSPELTARLELELAEVEKGRRAASSFMRQIAQYTTEVIEIAKAFDLDRLYTQEEMLGPCPGCGDGQVHERTLVYACAPRPGVRPSCGFQLFKEIGGRYLDRSTMSLVLAERETPELDGFRTAEGQDYKARLVLREGRLLALDAADLVRASGLVEPEFHETAQPRVSARAGAGRFPGGSSPSGAGARPGAGPSRGASSRPGSRSPSAQRSTGGRGGTPASGEGAWPAARPRAAGRRTAEGGAAAATPARRPPREGASRSGGVGGAEGAPLGEGRPNLGPCPVHGADCQVIETRGAYVCQKRLEAFQGGAAEPSGFWLPKRLCQRELSADEAQRYLATGATAVLDGFLSKAGRPFKASLKLGPDGGFVFVFPDREGGGRERR